ncbi:MAG: hypothetical protein AB8B64_22640 [Granulosicoccus sp.]
MHRPLVPILQKQEPYALSVTGIAAKAEIPSAFELRDSLHQISHRRRVLDVGWIHTFSSDSTTAPQPIITSEGGSGPPIPGLSIEIDTILLIARQRKNLISDGNMCQYVPSPHTTLG